MNWIFIGGYWKMKIKKINTDEIIDIEITETRGLTYKDLESHSKFLCEPYAERYSSPIGVSVFDEDYNEFNHYNDGDPFDRGTNYDPEKVTPVFEIIPVVFIKNSLKVGDWYLIKNKPFVAVEKNKLIGLSKIGSYMLHDNSQKSLIRSEEFEKKCFSDFFK
jgi:hypothetical protein